MTSESRASGAAIVAADLAAELESVGGLAAVESGVARNMATYAGALDRGDHSLLRGCFTPDVVASYQGGNHTRGVEMIVSYVTSALEPFLRTQHAMGASRVIGRRSAGVAVETYCVAYLLEHGEQTLWTRGLCYRDLMIKDGDAWLVEERAQECFWMTRSVATPVESIWPGSVAKREEGKDGDDNNEG